MATSEPDDDLPSPFDPLAKILAGVTRPGDFCAHGSVVTPIPRIDVEGVGTIAFPLPRFQAEQLLAAAEAAPYGRGAETLVDADVRRAWQLPPGRVRFQDPHWEQTLGHIVDDVARGLGVSGAVTAELYKMLVYDTGGFFVPHRDTEKAPHMFGTLVIVLPSTYQGGELVVRHGGREAVLPLAGEDVARVSYGAFYADCVHELRPITAGYRLCLVYNLVRAGAARPRPPDNEREVAAAAAFLRGWVEAAPDEDDEDDEGDENEDEGAPGGLPPKLVYLLEHHYTPAELSFAALKNRDAAVASVLVAAAARADAVIHLAMVSIEESGSAEPTYYGGYGRHDEDDDFEIVEVLDRVETVAGWISPDGSPAAIGQLPIHEGELYPPEALSDEEPDEKHLHEATGNGGASFERTYRRAAVVVWPRRFELDIVAEAPLASLVGALGPLAASADPAARQRALALAARIVDQPRHTGDARVDLLRELVRLGDAALVTRFVREHLRHGLVAAEATELLACHRLLGGDTLGALVAAVFEVNALARGAVCLDLLDGLAAVDLAAARAAAPTLLDRLPGDPAAVAHLPEWSRPKPDAASLARLYAVLARLGAPALFERATAYTVAHLAPAHLDAVVLPALLTAWEDATLRAPLAPVRAACLAHLRRRTAEPCAPPTDWARAAPFTCKCAECKQARAFLADPQAPRWELKAVQERRVHVESQLADADVDTHTERKGSPHRLVCVKNQRSYNRRAAQRTADLAALAALGAG